MASKRKSTDISTLLPVTTLCGFLGAGKTTLLQHILYTKHNEKGDFKCAVIVNDVAELNIDAALIDQSALVQSDDVIAMQNGCVCCTLKNDLVEQITELAAKGTFDYMIIEASGVSEPSEIAQMFADCDDQHDHDEEHGDKQALGDLARLDTCVTVVDALEFLSNMDSVHSSGRQKDESCSQLLVEQVEYANVIILNKTDMVDEDQLEQVKEQLNILNPRAKLLTSLQSKVDVLEVVDTKLYNADDFKGFMLRVPDAVEELSCCVASVKRGETACCKRARTVDSGLSQVMLSPKQLKDTRHSTRFNISSFVYKARRPFHPARFHENFVDKFFVLVERKVDDDGEREEDADDSDGDGEPDDGDENSATDADNVWKQKYVKMRKNYAEAVTVIEMLKDQLGSDGLNDDGDEEKQDDDDTTEIQRLQTEAKEKRAVRESMFGNLLRSKGFAWVASTHDMIGVFSQAGNSVTTETLGVWNCLNKKAHDGGKAQEEMRSQDWQEPWGDRRQDFVFIGKDLKHASIQETLDACLLTDAEMALGVDGWKATMGDVLLDIGE